MTNADKNTGALPPEPNPDPSFEQQLAAMRKAMFNFGGRIGRARFWLGALGLFGLMMFLLMAASVLMRPTGAGGGELLLIVLLAIPFLWFYCKLIVHRLHDLGWSGWWFLLLGPILIPLPVLMMKETHDVYQRIEQSYAAQQAIKPYVAMMQYGAFFLFFGGFILMGCLRGTAGPNKYGPDPRFPAAAPKP